MALCSKLSHEGVQIISFDPCTMTYKDHRTLSWDEWTMLCGAAEKSDLNKDSNIIYNLHSKSYKIFCKNIADGFIIFDNR